MDPQVCPGVAVAWAVSWIVPIGVILLITVYCIVWRCVACRVCRERCCRSSDNNQYAVPLLGAISEPGQTQNPYTEAASIHVCCLPEGAFVPFLFGFMGVTLLVMTLSGYEKTLINDVFTWGGFKPDAYLAFAIIFTVGFAVGVFMLVLRPCLRACLDAKNAKLAEAVRVRQQQQRKAQQEETQRRQKQQRQQQLLDECVKTAIKLLETADFRQAQEHIDTGLKSFPDAPRLMRCRQSLNRNSTRLPPVLDEAKQLLDSGKV